MDWQTLLHLAVLSCRAVPNCTVNTVPGDARKSHWLQATRTISAVQRIEKRFISAKQIRTSEFLSSMIAV